MEVFVVSFLVFASVAGLLALGQLLAGRRLPVGCRPESGICCRTAGGRAGIRRSRLGAVAFSWSGCHSPATGCRRPGIWGKIGMLCGWG